MLRVKPFYHGTYIHLHRGFFGDLDIDLVVLLDIPEVQGIDKFNPLFWNSLVAKAPDSLLFHSLKISTEALRVDILHSDGIGLDKVMFEIRH